MHDGTDENEHIENEFEENSEENSEELYKFSDGSHDETEDNEQIQEAVIISEKKIPVEKRELKEDLDKRLHRLLSNLPEDAANKFQLQRLPDLNLAGSFRIPCDIKTPLDPVYWNKSTDPADIYADIQKIHGGGIYEIKAHNNRGFVTDGTWHYTVPDPTTFESKREKDLRAQKEALAPPPAAPAPVIAPAAPAAPALDLLGVVGQILPLVEAVDKIKTTFAPVIAPAAPAAPAPAPPTAANPLDAEKTFLLEIYKDSQQPDLKNKIVNAMIGFVEPPVEQQPSFWQHAFDTIITGAQNSPGFQEGAKEVFSAIVQLGTAYVTSKMLPPATSESGNAPLPPFPPIPTAPPDYPTTPENVAIPPATEQAAPIVAPLEIPDLIPEINLGDE